MDNVLNQLANVVASKVARQLAPLLRNGKYHVQHRRKLDMNCRVGRCKNRSRGPRFGYICDEHRKALSKREQQAARDAYNALHAAGNGR